MKSLLPHIKIADYLAQDTKLSGLWLVIRLYVGWIWLTSGWEKVVDSKWVGPEAGAALTGFVNGALQKTGGEHPAVLPWYAWFLENIVLPNAEIFSYLVSFGEVAVGAALILGIFTADAAFFGLTMNAAFMLAGSAGLNPFMFILQLFLLMAWRTAGYIGLDKVVIPYLVKLDKNNRIFRPDSKK